MAETEVYWSLPIRTVSTRRGSIQKAHSPYALDCLCWLFEAALGLFLVFLLFESVATADEGETTQPSYTGAELEQQASEWDAFNSMTEQEFRLNGDRGLPDNDPFGPEHPIAWQWWDDRDTTEGKALRARIIHWLRAHSYLEGASDLTLKLVLELFESVARMHNRINELQAESANNALFAGGHGRGSERERFSLWTDCKLLRLQLFVHPQDETFADSVKAAVESRLRGARLYAEWTNDDTVSSELTLKDATIIAVLGVKVVRGHGHFSIKVGLRKPLFDPITGRWARTYPDSIGKGYGSFGSGHPEYIRFVLADHIDKFIADYLRVNADACGNQLQSSE